jgi:hypothetical protein
VLRRGWADARVLVVESFRVLGRNRRPLLLACLASLAAMLLSAGCGMGKRQVASAKIRVDEKGRSTGNITMAQLIRA